MPLDAALAYCQRTTRLQLLHLTQRRPWRGTPKIGKVVAQSDRIDFSVDFDGLQDSLDLAREEETSIGFGIIERLDPQTIAGNEQLPLYRIPDREGEYPIQSSEHIDAIPKVEVKQHLRI